MCKQGSVIVADRGNDARDLKSKTALYSGGWKEDGRPHIDPRQLYIHP
jgi:hypothetical protein